MRMDPEEEEAEEKAINELELQIFKLRMRQCDVGRSEEEFDSCEKQIELLHKDLEVLVMRKFERTVRPPPVPDYMTGTGVDERKDRVFLNVENEQETEEDFESETIEADCCDVKLNLNLGEEIDDSRIGSGAFNDPDLGICTNMEGLGESMRGLILESHDEMQKPHHLIERIRGCIDSDQEPESLEEIKSKAVDLGTKLCHMLVDFVFSMTKTEELAQKFQSLISRFEDENSLVIGRFTILLEMTKVDKSLIRGYFVKLEQEIKEEEIDNIIHEFVEEIMRLPFILEHKDMPESRILKGEVIAELEAGIEQCERKLEEIEMEVVGFIHVDFWESQSQMVNSQREDVKSKIDQVWKGFWQSEDENH